MTKFATCSPCYPIEPSRTQHAPRINVISVHSEPTPSEKSYQVPSNKAAFAPPEAPKLKDIKLIDYNFKKYGSSAERTRLLAKWDKEVKTLPK